LAALVDRLATRLGSENVVRPVRVSDPQPEAAFRYVSLVGSTTSRRRGKAEAATPAPPAEQDAPRPISLWPPQALVVVCAAEGPPARFHWQGEEHRVVQAWGPERIETGWWRWTRHAPPLARRASEGTATPRICRDYYRVETDRGAHLWLFRQRTDGRWFCHGSFD
jgi:protein ImuB